MSPFSTRARRIWLMIGTCSIPTGQISTHAMHCMHDQSVSDLMVPRICACSGNSGRDAERGAVPHRALGHLAQVEDEVAGRERIAGRRRGTGGVALAALRAGVEVEQVLGREGVDEGVADVRGLRAGGDRREAVARPVVLDRDPGRAGEHVHRLRERDRGDPEERDDAVHPPVDGARVRRGAVLEAEGTECVPDRVAHGCPHLEARVVRGDPKRLEQEPGEREEEEAAEEDPVAEPVAARLVSERLRRLDGPPVARRNGLRIPRLTAKYGEADDEGGAEDVEEERVDLVEPPVPEVEAQDRLGEVVLEGEDGRAREEHHEAVEDEEVADAGEWVAPFDPRVGDDDLAHPDEALARVLDLPRAAPAPVLEDEAARPRRRRSRPR